MKITNIKEARACIGKMVYWEDHGQRYVFLRCGVLQGVQGKNLKIDDDWKWRTDLTNLSSDKPKEMEQDG